MRNICASEGGWMVPNYVYEIIFHALAKTRRIFIVLANEFRYFICNNIIANLPEILIGCQYPIIKQMIISLTFRISSENLITHTLNRSLRPLLIFVNKHDLCYNAGHGVLVLGKTGKKIAKLFISTSCRNKTILKN